GDLLDDLFDLVVFEPRVDDLQLLPQHGKHHDLGETLAEGIARMLFAVAIQHPPLQTVKLIKKRLFDVIAFVEPYLLRGFVTGRHRPSLALVWTLLRP